MIRNLNRVPGGPILTIVALVILALGLAGCSDDSPTQAPAGGNDPVTGVFHVDLDDDADFEIISAKNGDPADPIEGPFAILGRNIRYDSENGALVMDLSVKNLGENTFDEPVMLTFLSLLPDGVTVLNPDNEENGAGAAITFEFENDDNQWTPGEESFGRETHFGVDEGVSIGFVARLDTGMGGDIMGSVGGMVWDDVNEDGIMDEGEAGVEGAMLELSAEGMEAMTTLSGADGTYRFDDLPMGFYQVVKKPMDGMVGTTASMIYVVLLAEDGTVAPFLAANFGCTTEEVVGTAVIKGKVWNDLNGDGNVNDGEPGLMGVTVNLTGDATATATTLEDGTYAFTDLYAGSYEVASVGPEGWVLTTGSPIQVILVADDEVFNEGSFGWMEEVTGGQATISGVVFNDLNGNRIQDEGEPGLEGIPVGLSGAATATVNSDADGAYSFTELALGDYEVTSAGLEGWFPTTGPILMIRIEVVDQVVDDAHLGWTEEASGGTAIIKGKVWNDLNGDGLVNDGEPGLEGITVNLAGEATATATTIADGTYAFEGLSAGDYIVTCIGPEGWSATTVNLIRVTLDTDDQIFNEGSFGWIE